MLKEFKEFAFKGNVVDMAVGVVVGGAFGKIVSSLVSDIITPLISLLTGAKNFSELFVALKTDVEYATIADAQAAGVATLNYGAFIQNIIDFFIIAFSIFLVVSFIKKGKERIEKLAAKEEEKPAEPAEPAEPKPTTEDLLSEIRDLLKESKKD